MTDKSEIGKDPTWAAWVKEEVDRKLSEAREQFKAGKELNAIALCRTAERLDPNNVDVYWLEGLIYLLTGECETEWEYNDTSAAGRCFDYVANNDPVRRADPFFNHLVYGGQSDMRGADWVALIGICPKFADRCVWVSLNGDDWAELLSEYPQFADKCDWSKLDGGNWERLLRFQPQFADRRVKKK